MDASEARELAIKVTEYFDGNITPNIIRAIGFKCDKTTRKNYFRMASKTEEIGLVNRKDMMFVAIMNGYDPTELFNNMSLPKGYFDPQSMSFNSKTGLTPVIVNQVKSIK